MNQCHYCLSTALNRSPALLSEMVACVVVARHPARSGA
jgi:hypothetical protein